ERTPSPVRVGTGRPCPHPDPAREDRLTSAIPTPSSSLPFLTKRASEGTPGGTRRNQDARPRQRRDGGPATDEPQGPGGRRDEASRDERAGGSERQHLAGRDPVLFRPAGARPDRA